MKRNFFKQLLTALALLCCTIVSAHDWAKNGIYYVLGDDDTSVYVSFKGTSATSAANEYSGDVVIPSTVELDGDIYTVTGISAKAFSGCNALTGVTIPTTVTELGSQLFNDCPALTKIVVEKGNPVYNSDNNCNAIIETASNTLVYGCKATVIPTTVVTIGDYAFYTCTGLGEVVLHTGVTTIGTRSFYGSSITAVTIPESVTSIGSNAFNSCSALKSITSLIPGEELIAVSTRTFSGVDKSSCVLKVPAGSKVYYSETEGWSEFTNIVEEKSEVEETSAITYSTSNGSATVTGYNGTSPVVEIPATTTINGTTYNVTAIAARAFYNKAIIESVIIPEGVTTIGNLAFGLCTHIKAINIPASVSNIGSKIFYGCKDLATITVESGNNKYDSRNNCNAIVEKSSNTLIAGCQSTVIPGTVTAIGANAFYACSTLQSISIPASVLTIGDYAFYYCTALATATLGAGVESIGSYAFYRCNALKEVALPASTTTIGTNAFAYCGNIAKLTVSADNIAYEGSNNAIIEIETKTLVLGCKNTIIPEDVVTIQSNAFNGSSIASIEFPASVKTIKANAFANCSSLKDTYFETNLTIENNALPTTAKKHLVINDSDAIDFDVTIANTFDDVTYNRTLAAGKYATIMLPFTPDAASCNNYIFYELNGIDGEYLTFDEVTAPKANTPYLYILREGKTATTITGSTTTISSVVNTPVSGNWQTVGSYTKQKIQTNDEGYYAFSPSKNAINRITKTLSVSPFRAYFLNRNAVLSALSLTFGGTTDIEDVFTTTQLDGTIYDINGRAVTEPVSGEIYIINGKKVVF